MNPCRNIFVSLWMILLLGGLAFEVSTGLAQETRRTDSNESETLYRVRKIFVPEGELQKVIRGRYLPIELEKLDELLKRAESSSIKPRINSLSLELQWSPEDGLKGVCQIELDQELWASQLTFDSNLHLTNLRCLDSEFSFANIGRKIDGRYSMSAAAGTRFECDVSLANSTSLLGRRIILPANSIRSISMRIPEPFRIVSTAETHSLLNIKDLGKVASRDYRLVVNNPTLELSITPDDEKPLFVFSNDILEWQDKNILWSSSLSMSLQSLTNNQYTFLVDAPFECESVLLFGQPIAFRSVNFADNALTGIQVENPGLDETSLEFELKLKRKIGSNSALNFKPLSLSSSDIKRSTLQIRPSALWTVDSLVSDQYSISGIGIDGVKLVQTKPEPVLRIKYSKKVVEIQTEIVEFDFRNDELSVRQLISGLQRNGVLRLAGFWNVQSVIDVQQDDLPVPFLSRTSSSGPILSVENEGSTVWVVATRKIDSVTNYACQDFVPVKAGTQNCLVDFKSGFLSRFSDGVESPMGISGTVSKNGNELFRFSKLDTLRFRLAADIRQFQNSFDSIVDLELEGSKNRVNYSITWDPKQNRRLIFEINVEKLESVLFEGAVQGAHRKLNLAEKRSLGLSANRQYWMFEIPSTEDANQARVSFSLPKLTFATAIDVQLPQPIGETRHRGILRIRNSSELEFDIETPLIELTTLSRSNDRIFQFADQQQIRIQPNESGAPTESVQFHVVSNSARIVDQRSFLQEIEIVFRDPANVSPSSTHSSFVVSSDDGTIKKVFLEVGNLRSIGRKVILDGGGSQFRVRLPVNTSGLRKATLTVAAIKDSPWNQLQLGLPRILINGTAVEQDCIVETGAQWEVVDLNQVFSEGVEANLRNLVWLPSLGFDSATSSRFIGERSAGKPFLLSPGQAEPLVLLVPKMLVTLVAIVFMGIFIAIALRFKRNRYVLFVSLIFLFLVFLFGGAYGLLAAMAFWGFAIGLIMRELNRLCQFSPSQNPDQQIRDSQPSRSGLIVLAVLFVGSGVDAQDKSGSLGDEQKNVRRQDVAAFIPVDKDDKPKGIAYLPADIYELLTKQKRSTSSLVCQQASFEILPATDSQNLAAVYRFELTSEEPRRFLLPIDIEGAILDSQAVTVNSKQVAFQPINGKGIEFEIAKAGNQSVEIAFQVPLRSKKGVDLKLPFEMAVDFENRSDIQYSVFTPERKLNDENKTAIELRPSQSKLIDSRNTLRLVSGALMNQSLTVLEVIDLRKTPATRQLKIVAREPIEEKISFTLGKQSSPDAAPEMLRKSGSRFEIQNPDLSELDLAFTDKVIASPGIVRIDPFVSSTHQIEKHLLVVRGVESNRTITSHDPLSRADFESKWGNVDADLVLSDLDQAFELNEGSEFRFWINPARYEITCAADHHYYVTNNRVDVKSEFELSSELPVQVVRLELPSEIKDVKFRMGEKELNWIRHQGNEVSLFARLDQPGRYQVELSGWFPTKSRKIRFLETKFSGVNYRSTSHFWTNRHVIIEDGLSRVANIPSSSSGFIYAGNLEGGNHLLEVTPNPRFTEMQVSEAIRFFPGKTTHTLGIELAEYSIGQWIGIELPRGSDLTELQLIKLVNDWNAKIEEPNVLSARQIWIPLVDPEKREFKMEFDQMIEGNRVEFAKLINCQAIRRQVDLPESINDKNVIWDIEAGIVVSSVNDRVVWEVNQNDSAGQFLLREDGFEPMSVRFSEVLFDEEQKRITCRYYVEPGDQGTAEFKLDKGDLIDSIKVCGTPRQWTMLPNNRIQIQLLNNRFFQIVDLTIFTDGIRELNSPDSAKSFNLPVLESVKEYTTYFQCQKIWQPNNAAESDFDELSQLRTRFVESAINNFELNLEQSEGWQGVLRFWVKSIFESGEIPDEISDRLANFSVASFPGMFRPSKTMDTFCRPGSKVFKVVDQTIRFSTPKQIKRNQFQVQILVAIGAMGALALLTVRLPHWFRAPIFSFVMISLIWVFGVTWISITPESIFAWCWLLFACLFVALVIVDAVLKIRAYVSARSRVIETGRSEQGRSTQQQEGTRTASGTN